MTTADLFDLGIGPRVAEVISELERFGEARLVMEIARRNGIPRSEVRDRWSRDDLAYEVAYDILVNAESVERCSQCHTVAGDAFDPDRANRPLAEGKWKLELLGCPMCWALSVANRDLTQAEKDAGLRWEIRPRRPGDPFHDAPSRRDPGSSRVR